MSDLIEQSFEPEQTSQKLSPFTKKTIATRIERLSVSHRNGDQSEVKQILNALSIRGQKITHGFEAFVATRSDLEILKALEPLLLVTEIGDVPNMEKILLKYSKFNLTYELFTKVVRIYNIPPEKRRIRFSSFIDLFNSQPIENFFFALDFFRNKGISLERIEELFTFEKVLMMSDEEIINLINKLGSKGIQVKIRKLEEEIVPDSPRAEAYRPILQSDYSRENWYGFLHNTPWLNSFRKLERSLNLPGSHDSLPIIEELLKYNNNFSKVINVLIPAITTGKVNINEANRVIIDHCLTKDYVSIQAFIRWYETVAKYGRPEAIEALQDFSQDLHPERNKSRLALDIRSTDNLLENREWQNIYECLEFVKTLTEIQNSAKPSDSAIGYFFLNCGFFTDSESVYLLENQIGRKISQKEFYLGLSCFEDVFKEEKFFSWIEYGRKLNYLDDRAMEKVYKIGLLQLNLAVLNFAISTGQIQAETRTSIRHQLLRFELSSGSFENGRDLFLLTASLKDTDEFDPVLLVQSSPFERFSEVEDILSDYLKSGGKIDAKTPGSLCNRYARNNQYEDVLRILEVFKKEVFEDDTILSLYRLAALSNLGREAEALLVLSDLLKSRNQFLIQKYAPSILKKIENQKLSSIASALNFELANFERPITVRKVIESPGGITRNRNLPSEIKKMYDYLCQVCKVPLNTPFGLLSEAAHIQGLGHPHYGSDDITNLLCLCPNHHKLFDNSGWYLNDELQVVDTLTKNVISELFVVEAHQISLSAISYQRNYAINASSKGQRVWA